MNEITNALRVANAAFKTVRIIDIAKKAVIVSATATCCILALKFCKNR